MRQKTAKKLRKVCVMSSFDPKTVRSRYKNLKKNWKRVPWKSRNNLYLLLLEKAVQAQKIREQRKADAALDPAPKTEAVS